MRRTEFRMSRIMMNDWEKIITKHAFTQSLVQITFVFGIEIRRSGPGDMAVIKWTTILLEIRNVETTSVSKKTPVDLRDKTQHPGVCRR